MPSPSVPDPKPLPTPVSAADMKNFKPMDTTATAYKSLISNSGGSAGLSAPASTTKKTLLGA